MKRPFIGHEHWTTTTLRPTFFDFTFFDLTYDIAEILHNVLHHRGGLGVDYALSTTWPKKRD